MGAARNNLAEVYRQTGQFAKAEPLYRRSVTILEKALGPTHPEVALALSNLALFFMTTGQYATADTLYQRSLMIFEKAYRPTHPDVRMPTTGLAAVAAAPCT